MGSGRYDADIHARTTTSKLAAHGTAFAYSSTAHAAGIFEAHETMKPGLVAGPTSPFVGSVMRESVDTDEHPESLPIAVFFDMTGSMRDLPALLQSKLPKLYGLLMAKGYVEHPQIMFGAIGDCYSDRVPLQVGQFESDNRADENLENLFLEGGGGGGNHESYELAAYFMAKHTHCDAWEKRGKKGYLFLIGDERIYAKISKEAVKNLIGDTLQEDMDTRELFDLLKQKWEIYFLFAEQGSYEFDQVVGHGAGDATAIAWSELLGQNALRLEDASAICETIALAIGMQEGEIDLDTGLGHLRETGSDEKAIESANRALATVGASTGGGSGSTDADLDITDDDGAERL